MTAKNLLITLSSLALALASCDTPALGEKLDTESSHGTGKSDSSQPFAIAVMGQFDEPWAMAFDPSLGSLFVTERKGSIRFLTTDKKIGTVSGVPSVAYGGQGGLGDILFAPAEQNKAPNQKTVYLSWAHRSQGSETGAVVGKANLVCDQPLSCRLENMNVIWRQTQTVGEGHYSHRITFSPDGKYLFISSGDRQKFSPAQDLNSDLGKVIRLLPDGTPAPGNPFADKGRPANQIWSYGHRNILGLEFDTNGQLWDLEHGPKGGDELNLVKAGANYGWPLVSEGDHYDGKPIPRNATRPDLSQPAIGWTPVIAPGNFIFYNGNAFPQWKGDALITGLSSQAIIRVRINGTEATEVARYSMKNRIRDIIQAPDGSIWLAEDGESGNAGRILKLTPNKSVK